LYGKLGIYYDDVNLDSSVFYGDQAATVARRLNLKLNEANIITNMTWPLGKMGNYPRALKLLNQAMEIANNPAIEKNAVHLPPGQTPHVYRLTVLSYVQNAMASLYGFTGNYEKQIAWAKESIKLALLLKDTLQLALIYPDIGVSYLRLNQLDSAIYYELVALKYYSAESVWERKFSAEPYLYLGQIYMQKGDLKRSKEYFEKTIQVCDKQNNLAKKGEAHLQLAHLFHSLNRIDSSMFHAKKALESFLSVGKAKSIALAFRAISDFYSVQNKADSSFTYLRKATLLNDSLDKAEKEKLSEFQLAGFEETLKLQELEKDKTQTQNKIRTYALLAGLIVFLVIAGILYMNNRQKQKTNTVLEKTLSELKSTQSQLIQSEKMASLGELTAGIAHEIQNPLNFMNNFSEINSELIIEMLEEVKQGNLEEVKLLAGSINENEKKIHHHGQRADAIVKGMLQHSRTSSGQKEPADINALADEYLRLSYHAFQAGLRAKDNGFNATMKTNYDETIDTIQIIPQDVSQVLLNIFNNAFYSVNEKMKKLQTGQEYEPIVSVSTRKLENKVEIRINDNGMGIPQNVLDKVFQPFFTTKPTGQGTGLGLSLSYDIVRAHNGELKINTREGEYAEFIILLPL